MRRPDGALGTVRAGAGVGRVRLRFHLEGTVQGVGFRPSCARLASELGLSGWVRNTPGGVALEIEGAEGPAREFSRRLREEAPPLAKYHRFLETGIEVVGEEGFSIRPSETGAQSTGWVLPDLGTCEFCLSEFRDPADRRHLYPFLSCTGCGPRYSILEGLPYDRERTSMRRFPLCAECGGEYADLADRRFHAETTACPACGPKVWFEGPGGTVDGEEALERAARLVKEGSILAVLGLGGFLLVCDATDGGAVRELRKRKRREARPLAVMFPAPASGPLSILQRYAEPGAVPEARFTDAVRPIVILPEKPGTGLAPEVGMGLPWVGAYLPTTALHLRLLDRVGAPVVSTSGNASGEPILTSPEEGRERLGTVADGFLLHDRPILRGVDDSVVRWSGGSEMVLRRARGLAPLPVGAPFEVPPVLGLGGQMKVALAMGLGDRVAVGPHLGDLESASSLRAFRLHAGEFPALLGAKVAALACDNHPGYASSKWAQGCGMPLYRIQHHHAHLAAVMGEAGLGPSSEVLGLSWDGTGLGSDGRIWGGEWMRCGYGNCERLGAFLPFPLLGGDRAAEEPRRVALALVLAATNEETVHEVLGEKFTNNEFKNMLIMVRNQVRECTSLGRLFDGFSCLILGCTHNRFEGEAPMRLEAACSRSPVAFPPATLLENGDPHPGGPRFWVDWRPWVRFVLENRGKGDAGDLAAGFHDALTDAALDGMNLSREWAGGLPAAAGGGCFQNARLLEGLRERMPDLLVARELPPNDGGLSYGQVLVSAAVMRGESGAPMAHPRGDP